MTLEKRNHKYFCQFSTRTLMYFLLTSCILFAVGARFRSIAIRQREAIAKIEDMGGNIDYKKLPQLSSLMAYIKDVLGDDYVYTVETVSLAAHKGDDDRDYSFLADLDYVETFFAVDVADFDDMDINVLSKWNHLKFAHLAGTRISDDGLKSLQSLPNLRVLRLDMTAITASGLEDVVMRQPVVLVSVIDNPIPSSTLQSIVDKCERNVCIEALDGLEQRFYAKDGVDLESLINSLPWSE